jgi:hypothetical protein
MKPQVAYRQRIVLVTRVVHENLASRPIDDSFKGHRVAAPQSRQAVSRALGHLRSSEVQLGGSHAGEQAHDRGARGARQRGGAAPVAGRSSLAPPWETEVA